MNKQVRGDLVNLDIPLPLKCSFYKGGRKDYKIKLAALTFGNCYDSFFLTTNASS